MDGEKRSTQVCCHDMGEGKEKGGGRVGRDSKTIHTTA